MALVQKSSVVQIRIDPDLLERFKVLCDHRDVTLSDFIRRFMIHQVEQFEGRKYVSAQKLLKTE